MKNIFLAVLFVFITFLSKSQYASGIDSLKKLLRSIKEDTSSVQMQVNISLYYSNQNNFDSGMYYGSNALLLAKNSNYKIGVIKSLNAIGSVYTQAGNFPKAMESFLQVLKLSEEIHYLKGVGAAYTNLGNIYLYKNDPKSALPYFLKSLPIFEKTNDEANLTKNLVNVSSAYIEINLDSALLYGQRGSQLATKNNYEASIATSYMNLGVIHQKLGNRDIGLAYLLHSVRCHEKILNTPYLSGIYLNIANFYQEQSMTDSSIHYATKSLLSARKLQFQYGIQNASQLLSQLYKPKNNDSTLKYLELFIAAKDSLFAESKEKEQYRMISIEKDRQRENEETQLRLKEERKTNLQYFVITIIITAIMLVFYFIRKRKVKRKIVKAIGLFGLLLLFEFIIFYIHPLLERWTNHNVILMFLIIVFIAVLLIPLHNILANWIKRMILLKNSRPRKPRISKEEIIIGNSQLKS